MDIVERLRSSGKAFRENSVFDSCGDEVRLIVQADECDEAADEIERLREALKKIASYPHGGVTVKGKCSGDRSDMILTARAALKGKS